MIPCFSIAIIHSYIYLDRHEPLKTVMWPISRSTITHLLCAQQILQHIHPDFCNQNRQGRSGKDEEMQLELPVDQNREDLKEEENPEGFCSCRQISNLKLMKTIQTYGWSIKPLDIQVISHHLA